MEPEKFKVKIEHPIVGTFANNDILHTDTTGADHELFTDGLKKSLFNYMHGKCLDHPLQKWFEEKVPKTRIAPDHIEKLLKEEDYLPMKPSDKVVYLGQVPNVEVVTKSKKGNQWEVASLTFVEKAETLNIQVDKDKGLWLQKMLQKLQVSQVKLLTIKDVMDDYEAAELEDFELFWDNKPVNTLYRVGLLRL
jgi:hypothetical protein